jgi:hypothetical protein
MSFFLMTVLAGLVLGVVRGCAKWIVLATVLSLICVGDPVLWVKLTELAGDVYHALREWILNLPS